MENNTVEQSDLVERLLHLRQFLNGEADIGGNWFGDSVERIGERPASFWWRAYLSPLTEAAARIETLEAALEKIVGHLETDTFSGDVPDECHEAARNALGRKG